jgi:DNA-binding XRE family transcriptional regulator
MKNNHPKSEPADFRRSTRARGGFDLPTALSQQYAREADPMPDLARDRLRAFRRAAGVTQHDMADLAGIARCTLANFEAGRFGLSLDAAARLRAVVASLPVVQASLW